ncbi:MAG: peptidoglycan DD-metalloendopeptidase family protein [Thermoanaerobaculia bacterium]|nr:peptidoglycan DD-metalloendopeptidase family protein [Thermoanaerobaculia bacterium]
MRRLPTTILVLTIACVAALLVAETRRLEAFAASPFPVARVASHHLLEEQVPAFVRDTVPADVPLAVRGRLRTGHTLDRMLREYGLDPGEAESATRVAARHLDLRRLVAGSATVGYYSTSGDLQAVALHLAGKGRFELTRSGGAWEGSWEDFDRTVVVRRAGGTLQSSLEAAVRRGGAPAAAAYEMAEVLQWDVDFNRDLRRGDVFELLYEEIRLEGEPYGAGDVLAVVLENGGRRIEAYRYRDGYYDAEGRPLQKLFLKSPLEFSRVTSRFSHRRFHPILKTYRPHYGIDYGAPTGTPVRVTAAGVVVSAAATKGGGRTVTVRHPNDYVTHYLHLSRYGDGVRAGRRVSQGDVIGFVGATGLATGPHLDYRVQLAGRWINPSMLQNEAAPPLATEAIGGFLAVRDELRGALRLFYGEPRSDSVLAASAADLALIGGD